ncbi:MAG: M20 family metallopeptidase, partial [Flavobacteriales bacterium]
HVDLVFQPAEEVIPGGAKLMLDDGLFAKQAPQFVFGQHVYPELPAGMVGVRAGAYMASTDEIYITIHGRGGHGAQPNVTIDPVVISAHIILALQHIPSRCAHPSMPTVLSIGKVLAHGATNVIPSSVRLEGTFRTFDEAWRTHAHELIRDTVTGIAKSMRAEAEVEIRRGYPVLNNDELATANFHQRAVEYLGAEQVVELDQRATAEDFAYYSQQFPSCFYRFGTSSPNSEAYRFNIHHPQFDIDESSLLTSAGLMAWIGMTV